MHPVPILAFQPLELHLRHAWTISRGTSHTKKNGLLTIGCEGIVGFGEAASNVRYGQNYDLAMAAFERIAHACKGLHPMEHREWLDRAESLCGPSSEVVAALDMALWDWKGKKLGEPVWRLLGMVGDPDRVAKTSYSIGIDSPEMLKSKIEAAGAFDILKIKLGFPGDDALLSAVRGMTQATLRVDANEGWSSVGEALDRIDACRRIDVELVEQPLPASDRSGLQAVFERSPLPIVADESSRTILDLADCASAFHGVNIKLSKCGGITRAVEMATAARAAGLDVMLGCMIESSLGIAAALALAPLAKWLDLDGNLLIAEDPFSGLEIQTDRWQLPAAPGLGVAPI
jgi:L-alanine-DL-glutamate epimerase-like enolase superfamily enzyme